MTRVQRTLDDLGPLGLLEAEVAAHLVRVVHVRCVAPVLTKVGVRLAIFVGNAFGVEVGRDDRSRVGGADFSGAGCKSRGSDQGEKGNDSGETHDG